jgi:hypothetical protein
LINKDIPLGFIVQKLIAFAVFRGLLSAVVCYLPWFAVFRGFVGRNIVFALPNIHNFKCDSN